MEYVSIQRNVHQPLIARIKILANLDIAEKRIPQDGHFRVSQENGFINIRVSVLPTVFGEKAVLRILASTGKMDHAGQFGMDDFSYQQFAPMLNAPNGIIYITGPTGSGKSTTLYMVLEYLSRRNVNISTIEDPVEKNLPGINQTQVNPVVGLVAQRLLRKVCPDCAKEVETTERERILIGADIRRVKRGMGCQKCNNTGYRGRIAIHEILVVDNHVRRMIIEHAPVEDIKKYAREVRKMRTLRESALQLVEQGVTTPEEMMKISYEI